ncbi:MAG: polysaccharide deacetylase family protein [Desulfosoma sp.]
MISLTFDLCETQRETSGYDRRIVSVLKEHNVKATFFASGKWMQSHPRESLEIMTHPLFELGAHGWAHENFRHLRRAEAEKILIRTQLFYDTLFREIQKPQSVADHGATPDRPHSALSLFRFPYGTCNTEVLQLLADYGIAAIQWDVVSGDAVKGRTAKEITRVVLGQSRPGSIVVFHANGKGHGTAEALPGLISALRRQGFEFAKVSELLDAGKPVTTPDCYELHPGDDKRYDRFR